ncbi:MAG: ATP-binding protein [Stenomitos rutilans HA7619-LM2]|jgi:hypothetical protein|nr:ATP-binding protein [Stenomitos rutilans HA7619-LM2]
MFQKATKIQSRLRLALSGASGSGKTYSALAIASHLGQSIAVIDSERGSASKYADRFNFDVCNLTDFHPSRYVEAIKAADAAGYDVIIIDSLSHAWFAELDLAGGNFSNWAKIKPLERALVDAMLSSSAHLIGTMRSKTEWIMTTTTNKSGKETLSPTKVGTAPMQAAGIEYEFDLAGELNSDHVLNISKSRCPGLSNTTHLNPGRELAELLLMWLTDGVEMPETGQSKRDRVKAARTAIGLDVESVKVLLKNRFEVADPMQLSSQQVDELIDELAKMAAHTHS